jgi:hypothetical protein
VQDKELYQHLLGLSGPQQVASVELDHSRQEIRYTLSIRGVCALLARIVRRSWPAMTMRRSLVGDISILASSRRSRLPGHRG